MKKLGKEIFVQRLRVIVVKIFGWSKVHVFQSKPDGGSATQLGLFDRN